MEEEITQNKEENIRHNHDGINSPKIEGKNLLGFKIFTSIPTHKAQEGTLVLVDDESSIRKLYAMLNKTWRGVSLGGSNFTIERTILNESDFTRDNTWRKLTLDSKYDDATMLLINVSLRGTIGNDMKLSPDSNNDFEVYSHSTTTNTGGQGLIPITTSGEIYYRIDSGISVINFSIIGYYN